MSIFRGGTSYRPGLHSQILTHRPSSFFNFFNSGNLSSTFVARLSSWQPPFISPALILLLFIAPTHGHSLNAIATTTMDSDQLFDAIIVHRDAPPNPSPHPPHIPRLFPRPPIRTPALRTGFGDSKSSSQSSQAAQQQQQSSSAQSRIRRGVQEIEDAYSPASQVCRLQALMYNRVPYNLRANYLKKRENVDPRLWEQAEKNNPDPIKCVFCCSGVCAYPVVRGGDATV